MVLRVMSLVVAVVATVAVLLLVLWNAQLSASLGRYGPSLPYGSQSESKSPTLKL